MRCVVFPTTIHFLILDVDAARQRFQSLKLAVLAPLLLSNYILISYPEK